jgi:hypothetical protein
VTTSQARQPHQFVESKTTPGTCAVCSLIRRNGIHDDHAEPVEDIQQRRAGDTR